MFVLFVGGLITLLEWLSGLLGFWCFRGGLDYALVFTWLAWFGLLICVKVCGLLYCVCVVIVAVSCCVYLVVEFCDSVAVGVVYCLWLVCWYCCLLLGFWGLLFCLWFVLFCLLVDSVVLDWWFWIGWFWCWAGCFGCLLSVALDVVYLYLLRSCFVGLVRFCILLCFTRELVVCLFVVWLFLLGLLLAGWLMLFCVWFVIVDRFWWYCYSLPYGLGVVCLLVTLVSWVCGFATWCLFWSVSCFGWICRWLFACWFVLSFVLVWCCVGFDEL